MTPQKTVIIGGLIFLTDIPISGQTGVPIEGSTWYDQHGMPNPDNAEQILMHRKYAETIRKKNREEDFWKEIGKRVRVSRFDVAHSRPRDGQGGRRECGVGRGSPGQRNIPF